MHRVVPIAALALLALSIAAAAAEDAQLAYLVSMKQSLVGAAMSRWDLSALAAYCNFSGLSCDDSGGVVALDLAGWGLVGTLPADLCAALQRLRSLDLSSNAVKGGFPASVLNCTALEHLSLSNAGMTGPLPDLSPMRRLRSIDLSFNSFTGAFPAASLANMTALEEVNFNMNAGFDEWHLPSALAALTALRVLILSTSSLRGTIPPWLGNMTSLVDLELAGNYLSGTIPPSLANLFKLEYLELYYNDLAGEIPPELGNLTALTDIDLSENHLTGPIPDALCALPRLRVLQTYTNQLTGTIPAVLGNSTTLEIISVYRNLLSGTLPPDLGRWSPLVVFEVSENRLIGTLPPHLCSGGRLLYILAVSNNLTGTIPAAYGDCRTVLRLRVSNNRLDGVVPPAVFGLPHASIIDIGYNRLEGPISTAVGDARNVSSLYLSNNRLAGVLPPEIAKATSLVKIDASYNSLSGPIPPELGRLTRLNQLALQVNRFDSGIPATLAALTALNVLNLSNNMLSGEIPPSICALLPNSLDFSNNNLSGEVPPQLIQEGLLDAVAGNPALCVRSPLEAGVLPLCRKPRARMITDVLWIIIGICAAVVAVATVVLLKRWHDRRNADIDTGSPSPSPSSFSYDITSFHKVSFEQHEITDALIDKNIVGQGGSGTVYKIELSSGELVAVKKLYAVKETTMLDRELRAEIETLGSVRHKNIVKLYCCYSGADVSLLVYEFLPNGNLWDALHGGWSSFFLDWPTRHRIAAGVAQGLAYLHHDLPFPIVHRDIKSSNVLLDADYEPKVADFGIAKVLQARGGAADMSTTTIAGTYGYLAPEYAYSSKATTKCDVYSYGVVLMELVTGRRPVEPEYSGEFRDIVRWVGAAMGSREGALSVVDERLAGSPFKEEMVHTLRVAARCTCAIPALRPTMADVVQMLADVDHCKPSPDKMVTISGDGNQIKI